MTVMPSNLPRAGVQPRGEPKELLNAALFYADQLVAAYVLERHKPGRAERYYVPQPEANRRSGEG